jgi:sulfopyruvate decarboxylase TPP-binding subunit
MTNEAAPKPLVESVPAATLHEAIRDLGVTHVLTVPDTHQKSLLASLMADPELTTLTLSTEDEALGVNAGLWMGGVDALVLIQNVGFFASMNGVRGVCMDMHVPTCMLVGQYARDVTLPTAEDPVSGVRLIEPVIKSLDIPYYVIDGPEDVGVLKQAYERSRAERGPVVVLVSAPTS